MGANIVPQYEQTIKRELEADIPRAFVKDYSEKKSYMDLINGARIMYRPLYKEGMLRSLNLSMFVIVEASEVNGDTYHQLKTRLRNKAASSETADWRKGIVESNPDSGWIRTDVLLASDDIQKHGQIFDEYYQAPEAIDPNTASHVASTDVNKHLPKNFIAELVKNKPGWWVKRYIHSSFSYSEGLVYPLATDRVVPAYEIPRDWKRIVAFDYGLSDNAVFIFAAIDEVKGKVVIYKEVVTNNRNIEQLAKLYFENSKDIPAGLLWCPPIIDPRSSTQRDYNKKTLNSHFLDYGIYFKPGHVNLDARIYRLNTYIELNRIEIMDTCPNLIKEFENYKFPDKSLTKNNRNPDKPVDKDNHAINPVEWIVMELPHNPSELLLGAFNNRGQQLQVPEEDMKPLPAPWENEEEDDGVFSSNDSGGFNISTYY